MKRAAVALATLLSSSSAFAQGIGFTGQHDPLGPMQPQLSVTTSAVVTLTVPTGATTVVICLRYGASSSINYSTDGTTPTTGATGNGRQLTAGQCVGYNGPKYISGFQAIATTATTAIDVEYGQ